MKKFIKVADFSAAFAKVAQEHPDMRILSIGTTSDGYYTFRCKDAYDNEQVFKVSCWEIKN